MIPVLKRRWLRLGIEGGRQIALAVIWAALACVFSALALEAHRDRGIHLPRSGFRVPPSQKVQVGTLRFQEAINTLAERYDQTASQMEQSIRSSARTHLWLNATAAFLSVVGLLSQYPWGRNWKGVVEDITPAATNEQAPFRYRPEAPAAEPIAMHGGSFPDEGYGR